MTNRELYRVERLPIFQKRTYSTNTAARECLRGDVVPVENVSTGLVSNTAFLPELMEYDRNYQNEQGNSALFQNHLQEIADLVERTMARERLVEVGCGSNFIGRMVLDYEGSPPMVAAGGRSKGCRCVQVRQ